MRRLLVAFAVFAALPVGCSASPENDTTTPVDSGVRRDTGARTDSSTVEDDGVVTDTRPPSDTNTGGDTSGKTCNTHTGDECDLIAQNCADVTSSCIYDGSVKHNVCRKVSTGTKLKGESCAVAADCDRGLECRSGRCSPACCSGDNSTCGTDGSCNVAIQSGGATVYYLCSYAKKCNPFKYDCPAGEVCLFDSDPDQFRCSTPSDGTPLNAAPGKECMFRNDCGESQGCSKITTGGDAAGAKELCYLYCYLTKPTGFTPGMMPGGRFPANGDCVVGGVSYGTCRDFSSSGLGGGLGICVK